MMAYPFDDGRIYWRCRSITPELQDISPLIGVTKTSTGRSPTLLWCWLPASTTSVGGSGR